MRDVMHRPLLAEAVVAGGASGLDHLVRSVFAGETLESLDALTGGELVLSTGMALTQEQELPAQYIGRLAEQHAAGLCLQLPPNWDEATGAMVEVANRAGLPLIVFRGAMPVVDIWEDVQRMIAGRYDQSVARLNTAFHAFHRLSRSSYTPLNVITMTSDLTSAIVVYVEEESGQVLIQPEGRFPDPASLSVALSELGGSEEPQYSALAFGGKVFGVLRQSVNVLGASVGCIYILIDEQSFDPEDPMILEHATNALSYMLMKEHVQNQDLFREGSEVLQDLILGKTLPTQERHLWQRLGALSGDRYFMIVGTALDQRANVVSTSPLPGVVREGLKRESLRAEVGVVGRNTVAVVCGALDEHMKRRMRQTVTDMEREMTHSGLKLRVGISADQTVGTAMLVAHRQAEAVLRSQELLGGEISRFYEEMGVYRILLDRPLEDLEHFVWEQLGPVLANDQNRNGDLIGTLRVYLNCLGHTNETARALFIHRQTLYYRLRKLRELLGSQLENPEQRLALEVALRALDIVESGNRS